MGQYFGLAAVGFEMVVPIAVGYWLDRTYGWSPWGAAVGAVLGLVGGLYHLITMANRLNQKGPPRQTQDKP
jgi:F0F1-type ATP synthase assembly protein I